MQKRIVAIHDISCFGKCSLTVALPILSAAGIETPIIPTAVLSTHTGGFTGYTFRDLTADILPIADHWRSSGIACDAVYTGYLGSKEQIGLVLAALPKIARPDRLFIADPAMADNGRLYAGFPADFPREMARLCAESDVMTPNITEAALMLGLEYKEGPYDKAYIDRLLDGLCALNGKAVVLTGVYFDYNRLGAVCARGNTREFIAADRINAFYHGTGDVFTSAFSAGLLHGQSLPQATRTAVDFTCACIRRTAEKYPEMRYGVAFEEEIPLLLRLLDISQ